MANKINSPMSSVSGVKPKDGTHFRDTPEKTMSWPPTPGPLSKAPFKTLAGFRKVKVYPVSEGV